MEEEFKQPHAEWFLLREGRNPSDYNMAADDALLEYAPRIGSPVLRFYGWSEGAASFGYSQKYADIEKLTLLRPLVRRPTGGGLVPHDTDWTYCLVFPPAHHWYHLKATESYRCVHEWIRDAFGRLNVTTTLAAEPRKEAPGQCFIGAEKNDVLWHGRKIAGAAQRRTLKGLLIQGSVQPPPGAPNREAWETAMCESAQIHFAIKWQSLTMTAELHALIENLRLGKFSRNAYNQKR